MHATTGPPLFRPRGRAAAELRAASMPVDACYVRIVLLAADGHGVADTRGSGAVSDAVWGKKKTCGHSAPRAIAGLPAPRPAAALAVASLVVGLTLLQAAREVSCKKGGSSQFFFLCVLAFTLVFFYISCRREREKGRTTRPQAKAAHAAGAPSLAWTRSGGDRVHWPFSTGSPPDVLSSCSQFPRAALPQPDRPRKTKQGATL